jgi:hypothetical protein
MLSEKNLFIIIGTDSTGAYSTAIVGAKTIEVAESAFRKKHPELNVYGNLSMVNLRQMLAVMEKVSRNEALDEHEVPPAGVILAMDL